MKVASDSSGDREAEARVDDQLLIPFRQCLSWSEKRPTTPGDGQSSPTKKEEIADSKVNVFMLTS
jgi:hypothetical protein